MKYYDAVVVGGGVLGCFAARNLRRWNLSAALVEAAEDVCTGITRANSAIVYAGYDNKTGSRKAQMTVAGNAAFAALCNDLEVSFSRCGSLMVSTGEQGERVLSRKYANGLQSGVPGLRLISGEEAREMEPMLSDRVTAALHAPTTGTVNPWQLGIAAFENAVANGCAPLLHTEVLGVDRCGSRYVVKTEREELECRVVLNCAGLAADKVQEFLFPPSIRLFCDGADFLVLDRNAEAPGRIIFHESEDHGRGITAIPTVEGNLLLGPTKRPLEDRPFATTAQGLSILFHDTADLLPNLDLSQVIRSFAAVRPNPHRVVLCDGVYVPDGTSIGSFAVENPTPGFWSLMGVKTPGLTCADVLGRYLAEQAAEYLNVADNTAFDPCRRAMVRRSDRNSVQWNHLVSQNSSYGEVICRCEGVTKGEILEAIARGARTVDGVKRRTGSGMGRCQGGRCAWEIAAILREMGIHDPKYRLYPRGG